MNQDVTVRFPVREYARVSGSIPSRYRAGGRRPMFLPLFLPLCNQFKNILKNQNVQRILIKHLLSARHNVQHLRHKNK